MPTSRARKNRLVSRQKLQQKVALQKKSKPGLKVTQRSVLQRKSTISNALQTILKYLKVTSDELSKQSCSPNGHENTDQGENVEFLPPYKFKEDISACEGQERLIVATAPVDWKARTHLKEDPMAVKIDFENELNKMETTNGPRGSNDSEFKSSSKTETPVLQMTSVFLNLGLLPLKLGKRIVEVEIPFFLPLFHNSCADYGFNRLFKQNMENKRNFLCTVRDLVERCHSLQGGIT